MFYETGSRTALNNLGLTKIAQMFRFTPGGGVQSLVPKATGPAGPVPTGLGGAVQRPLHGAFPATPQPASLGEAVARMGEVPVRHMPVAPMNPPAPAQGMRLQELKPATLETARPEHFNPIKGLETKTTGLFNMSDFVGSSDPHEIDKQMRMLYDTYKQRERSGDAGVGIYERIQMERAAARERALAGVADTMVQGAAGPSTGAGSPAALRRRMAQGG